MLPSARGDHANDDDDDDDDNDDDTISPSLTANSIWKSFLKFECSFHGITHISVSISRCC